MKIKPLIHPASLAVMAISFVTAAAIQSLPPDRARALTSESGPFEIISALTYGVAVTLAACQLWQERTRIRLSALVMLLWAFLRELDYQKRFTYRSIESIGYYTRPYAPWPEKLLALAALTPFAVAGVYLLFRLVRRLRSPVQEVETWQAHWLAIIILIVSSSVMEKLLHWGAAEEVCEAGLAIVVVLLVWALRPRSSPASA